jgi:hypothetical protein
MRSDSKLCEFEDTLLRELELELDEEDEKLFESHFGWIRCFFGKSIKDIL